MVTPKFVSFCFFFYNRQGSNIQYVEGFTLQMSIIVLFEQIKSGNFKNKSGKIQLVCFND
jgi:hypothetical protein